MDLGGALALAGTTGLALLSAIVPVVNAEALAAAAAATAAPDRVGVVLVVLAVAVGQTLGKIAMFLAARGGSQLWLRRLRVDRRERRPRTRRFAVPVRLRPVVAAVRAWTVRALDSPAGAGPLVLLSASLGIPPLLAVTVALGVRGRRLSLFVPCCLLGRIVRFGVIAASVLTVL